jgi:hypothetical protein
MFHKSHLRLTLILILLKSIFIVLAYAWLPALSNLEKPLRCLVRRHCVRAIEALFLKTLLDLKKLGRPKQLVQSLIFMLCLVPFCKLHVVELVEGHKLLFLTLHVFLRVNDLVEILELNWLEGFSILVELFLLGPLRCILGVQREFRILFA